MKINHRYYILILLALCALCASAFGYVVLYQKIVAEARASSDAIREVTLENEMKQREQELALLYADTLSQRSRLPSLIVSEKKIVEFIEAVEKIGSDTKTNLSMSEIDAPDLSSKPDDTIAYTEAHIEARGSWTNVMQALLLIENMPYSLKVQSIKLNTFVPESSLSKDIKDKQWGLSLDIIVLTSK